MSGRKQHFIPQFLLRGFAEQGKGKKEQVRVITRDQTFIASTEGVAAQREFYSKLGDGDGSLDDLITEAETDYAAIYQGLRAAPPDSEVRPEDVSRLLTHLAVRGKHTRDTFAVGGQHVFRRACDLATNPAYVRAKLGLDLREPNSLMRRRLDEAYNENKISASKARVSRHEFRSRAYAAMKENWDREFASMAALFRLAASTLDLSGKMEGRHQELLVESLEPAVRVEALTRLQWQIKEWNVPKLVLPDSVAIAHYNGVGAAPVAFVGDSELDAVFFPLSPTRAVCGGSYRKPPLVDAVADGFFTFAIASSWNFVVTPPSFACDTSFAAGMGQAVVQMISNPIDEAVAESLTEAFAG